MEGEGIAMIAEGSAIGAVEFAKKIVWSAMIAERIAMGAEGIAIETEAIAIKAGAIATRAQGIAKGADGMKDLHGSRRDCLDEQEGSEGIAMGAEAIAVRVEVFVTRAQGIAKGAEWMIRSPWEQKGLPGCAERIRRDCQGSIKDRHGSLRGCQKIECFAIIEEKIAMKIKWDCHES